MDSFGRTVEQAKPYAIDGKPDRIDIVIESKWDLYREDNPYWNDDNGEYMYSGMNFYYKLLGFEGLMLHSSVVVVDGKAYLFSADPGTGKSTHTQLWLSLFGDRAFILNDDKPALRLVNGVWYAYGTPWSGKYDISANVGVPIQGIAILTRGQNNEIVPYSGSKAIFDLYSQTSRLRQAQNRIKLLELLDKLMTQVPIWKLKCNMEPEAAVVAYEAMSGKKLEGEIK